MKMRSGIKQAYITNPSTDSSAYPRMQASYSGKPTDVIRLSPYGLDSNPPEGAFCLLIPANAQESVKYAISSDFLRRFKNLKEGEVAVYNVLTQSYMIMREDSSIEVKSSTKIKLEAPTVEIIGDIDHTGDQTTSGTIVGTTDVETGAGISLDDHVHGGVQTGSSDTGAAK